MVVMQSIVLEFDNQRAVDEAIAIIWDRLGVTGELSTQRLPEGRIRLEILSEKPLRANTLDKLGGRIVEA